MIAVAAVVIACPLVPVGGADPRLPSLHPHAVESEHVRRTRHVGGGSRPAAAVGVRERSHGDGVFVGVDAPPKLIAGASSPVRCELDVDGLLLLLVVIAVFGGVCIIVACMFASATSCLYSLDTVGPAVRGGGG